jgi:CBS domain-containing protein
MKTIRLLLKQKGKDIWSANPRMKVFDALQLMAQKDVGALPVLEGKKLVGIFSERDYARKVILEGKASKNTPVSEIMSTRLVTITPNQTNEQALALMTDKHIRHLPVLQEGKLIGFISIGDLVKSIIDEQKQVIGKLEQHIMETTGLN